MKDCSKKTDTCRHSSNSSSNRGGKATTSTASSHHGATRRLDRDRHLDTFALSLFSHLNLLKTVHSNIVRMLSVKVKKFHQTRFDFLSVYFFFYFCCLFVVFPAESSLSSNSLSPLRLADDFPFFQ